MKTVLKHAVIISLFLIITAFPAHADGTHPKDIKLDGTLGSAGKLDLPGPDAGHLAPGLSHICRKKYRKNKLSAIWLFIHH